MSTIKILWLWLNVQIAIHKKCLGSPESFSQKQLIDVKLDIKFDCSNHLSITLFIHMNSSIIVWKYKAYIYNYLSSMLIQLTPFNAQCFHAPLLWFELKISMIKFNKSINNKYLLQQHCWVSIYLMEFVKCRVNVLYINTDTLFNIKSMMFPSLTLSYHIIIYQMIGNLFVHDYYQNFIFVI